MTKALSDHEVLAAAQRGDAGMVEELLARHEKTIYRFGLRMCGSEEDAREVLQETLLAAFKNLPEFRGGRRALHLALPDRPQLLPQVATAPRR